MSLKVLLKKQREHDLYFGKGGRIEIRASVSKTLGLSEGDAINICEDRDETYIFKHGVSSDGRNYKAVCRKVNNGSRFFRVNCKELTNYILKKTKTDYAKLYVGDPVELNGIGRAVPIIIKSNMRHE